ncbi:uncharacterized protein LOC108114079 [Drosophila eugracilis]|uniref:uncharacterized protein LOC108114079 n=1 Tax=Drosophila eugracilis TaxID=29029 RepID=UPI0007E80D7A|nr:uncharacterized protein LOC108114079 [Drosophila eugracilis]
MMNALDAFGMAIGWMDIVGVFFFEVIMFYMMRRRRLAKDIEDVSIEAQMESKRDPLPNLLSRKRLTESENVWIFWGYLLMLNVWVVITLLMIAGISLHKPELMVFWLIWCACGLVFDVLFIFWWVYELFVGDVIEALTNILISLLTMGIEFGFIYVIYTIYLNLSNEPMNLATMSSMWAKS